MTLLNLLSTLTKIGWVVLAMCIASTLWYVAELVARRTISEEAAIILGVIWALLLYCLIPGGAP